MKPLDFGRILRVPFVEKGRTWAGWDCFGLVFCVAPEAYGFQVPPFDNHYDATDWRNAKQIRHAIERELHAFEEGPPGPAYPILTFERFGFRSHTGLAVSETHMLHADTIGEVGGTYHQSYRVGQWADEARKVKAIRPIGWTL